MEVARLLQAKGGVLGYDEVETAGELCELARQGSLDKLKVLLACGAGVNSYDYDKRACLHLAASEGNLSVVSTLVECSADVNLKDRWGGTPLRDAVRHGHIEVAKQLRAYGGDMGYSEVEASGELCELARQGSVDLLGVMLTCGVQVNAADYDKRTCLHLAASEGNIHVVELLVKSDADVNFKDRWGGTPLHDAVRERHRAVATALFRGGGQLGMDEMATALLLCQSARMGRLESVEDMVSHGADPNAKDYDGRTPLHIAAAEGHKAIVQALREKGCRMDAKDRWGNTAQQEAERAGHTWPETLWVASGGGGKAALPVAGEAATPTAEDGG